MAYFYGGYKGGVDPTDDDSCSSASDSDSGSDDVTDSGSDDDDSVKGGFWGGVPRVPPPPPTLTSRDRKIAASLAVASKNKTLDKKKAATLADKNEQKIEKKVLKDLYAKPSLTKLNTKAKPKTSKAKHTKSKVSKSKVAKTSKAKPKASVSKKLSTSSRKSSGQKIKRPSDYEKCKTYTVTRILSPKSKFQGWAIQS